jgi:Uncharacterized protein conserved in bacteria, putative lipoprotein
MLCLVLTSSLHAASFNCAKAKTRIEKAICSDKELNALDDTLSLLYAELKKTLPKDIFGYISYEQQFWIKQRNDNWKNDTSLLIAFYKQRVVDLKLKISLLKDNNAIHYGIYVKPHVVRFYEKEDETQKGCDVLDMTLINTKQLEFGIDIVRTNANMCSIGGLADLKGNYYEWFDQENKCKVKIDITVEKVTIYNPDEDNCFYLCGGNESLVFFKYEAVSKDTNKIW